MQNEPHNPIKCCYSSLHIFVLTVWNFPRTSERESGPENHGGTDTDRDVNQRSSYIKISYLIDHTKHENDLIAK